MGDEYQQESRGGEVGGALGLVKDTHAHQDASGDEPEGRSEDG